MAVFSNKFSVSKNFLSFRIILNKYLCRGFVDNFIK